MRPYDGSLIPSLTQYRKRKRSSLDGSVAGIEYNRHVAGVSSAFGQIQSPYGPVPSSYPSEYDPVRAAYDLEGPAYEPPAPWFEGMTQPSAFHPPSMLGISRYPPPSPLHEIRYEDSLMTQGLMERLLDEMQEASAGFQEIDRDGRADEMGILNGSGMGGLPGTLRDPGAPDVAMTDPVTQPDLYEIEQAIQQAQEDPFATMQAMCDQQQAFEDHVQMQPWELDPCMMAQQIYDEQMQQLQNPFMMPGLGPGP